MYVGPSGLALSSLFGHLFIVDEGKHFFESDSYSFVTEDRLANDGLAEYVYRGIGGGYDGFVLREPLYKSLRRYAEVEERALYFFEINKSKKNLENLRLELRSVQGAAAPYRFLSFNCASFFRRLFAKLYPDKIRDWRFFDYPVGLVSDLSNAGIVSLKAVWPASSVGVKIQKHLMTSLEVSETEECISRKLTGVKEDCLSLSSAQRQLLSMYYWLLVSKGEKIGKLNSISMVSGHGRRMKLEGEALAPYSEAIRDFPGGTKVGFVRDFAVRVSRISVQPLFRSVHGLWNEPDNLDELVFGAGEVEFESGRVKLIQGKLLSLASVRDFNPITNLISHKIHIGKFVRSEEFPNKSRFGGEVSVGVAKVSHNAMGAVWISGDIGRGAGPLGILRISTDLQASPWRRLKVGLVGGFTPYSIANELDRLLVEGFLSIGLSRRIGLQAKIIFSKSGRATENIKRFLGAEFSF